MLRFTSCQAPNSHYVARLLAEYLRARVGLEVEWVDDLPWPERYRQLEAGGIDVAWVCGAPYVRMAARGVPLRLLAAPVWRAPRYGGMPVYFSDVVVRAQSRFRSLADLRGMRWAYNEPGSLSGYECVRCELAQIGAPQCYFGAVTEAGSHQNALRLVIENAVDGAAIDITVLEEEMRLRPELSAQVRVVHTIGPSPMPPWVARGSVPEDVCARLRDAWLEMDHWPEGRALLAQTPLARLAAVDDRWYDPVRACLQRGATVDLGPQAAGANL